MTVLSTSSSSSGDLPVPFLGRGEKPADFKRARPPRPPAAWTVIGGLAIDLAPLVTVLAWWLLR